MQDKDRHLVFPAFLPQYHPQANRMDTHTRRQHTLSKVYVYQFTRRHIQEEPNVHYNRCENLKTRLIKARHHKVSWSWLCSVCRIKTVFFFRISSPITNFMTVPSLTCLSKWLLPKLSVCNIICEFCVSPVCYT